MKLKITSIIALAVLLAVAGPLFAQDKGVQNTNPQVIGQAPAFYIDVQGKRTDVADAYLKPVINGLTEAFDVKGGQVPKGNTGFELRVFVITKGDATFVTTILLAQISDKQPVYVLVGSSTTVVDAASADKLGKDTIQHIASAIDVFVDSMSKDRSEQ